MREVEVICLKRSSLTSSGTRRSLGSKHQQLWCRSSSRTEERKKDSALHVLNIFFISNFFLARSLCIFTLNNPQVIFVIVIKILLSVDAQFWYFFFLLCL